MCSPLISQSIFSVPIVVVLVAIQLLLVRSVSLMNQNNAYLYHICSSEGKYKPKSLYERNLNELIGDVRKGCFARGSVYTYYGEGYNTVYILLQCRGDTYGSKCRSCFTAAASELRKRCPTNEAAIIWFDKCLVKIAPIVFFGKIDDKNKFYMSSKKKVSDPASFNGKTKALLTKLTSIATRSSNDLVLYARGEMKLDKMKLYAMVQCTMDLELKDCKKCLDKIIGELPECCDGKAGGRVLSGSCYFRYEIYPFLDTVK